MPLGVSLLAVTDDQGSFGLNFSICDFCSVSSNWTAHGNRDKREQVTDLPHAVEAILRKQTVCASVPLSNRFPYD